jgi:hypothetical protein
MHTPYLVSFFEVKFYFSFQFLLIYFAEDILVPQGLFFATILVCHNQRKLTLQSERAHVFREIPKRSIVTYTSLAIGQTLQRIGTGNRIPSRKGMAWR